MTQWFAGRFAAVEKGRAAGSSDALTARARRAHLQASVFPLLFTTHASAAVEKSVAPQVAAAGSVRVTVTGAVAAKVPAAPFAVTFIVALFACTARLTLTMPDG